MTETTRLELTGAPGSPYTRKMIALLRYRHIPYMVYWGVGGVPESYPQPKVRLLPTFFFPDGDNGERVAVTDSTPIIRRLEGEHTGRSVIPTDPALAFINDLIEDYADEWLTKPMFHFRWAHEADWKNAGPLLVYWGMPTMDAEQAKSWIDDFTKRQIDRLYVVGSNEVTAKAIEDSYERLVGILDRLLQRAGYVLGARPSSADFALFGQMTQLAIIEPTSAAITNRVSQRVRAWLDRMDDMSGLRPDDDWSHDEAALSELLGEIGRTYAPVMIANAKAVMGGEKSFATDVDGARWEQPTFSYQAKCLGWLREAHGALSDDDRKRVDAMLNGTGCDALFA
ncbi:MAG: glutathione S-transferase N-terminal domain-containing protein [Pseudomonadota bacterium]